MGSEMDPLSSPGTTSYRLRIVTIGLSLTVFAVSGCFSQTDRQTDGFCLAIGGTMRRRKLSKPRPIESHSGARENIIAGP